jgi:hypothetical protein
MLDAAVQISAFGKLKLASCVRDVSAVSAVGWVEEGAKLSWRDQSVQVRPR